MDEPLEYGAMLLCFGNESHVMVGFLPRMGTKEEGNIDRCPRCGKLAEWFTFEYADNTLVIWDERLEG